MYTEITSSFDSVIYLVAEQQGGMNVDDGEHIIDNEELPSWGH